LLNDCYECGEQHRKREKEQVSGGGIDHRRARLNPY